MKYIVKFGETFLKSRTTKKKFISFLIESLKRKGVKKIEYRNAYLILDTDIELSKLINTFGVQKIEQIKYELNIDISNIDEDYLIKIFSGIIKDIIRNYDFSSFRITAKRENKNFSINSQDIQMILGKYISNTYNKIASYKKFDLEIKVRILNNKIWVWTDKDTYNALGGLPYGVEGKSLNLFSGGIDSPVATYMAAKRGIRQDFLFLNIPSSSLLLKQVFEIYRFLSDNYGIYGKFYTINFSKYILKIKQNIPSGYRQIVFKSLLYKISDLFSKKIGVKSVVLGENLGQVSTQTLTNIALLDKQNNILNLRPLLCYDKIEIIDFAKRIGTYKYSELIKETCSLEPNSNAKIKDEKKIEYLLSKLYFDYSEILNDIYEITDLDSYNDLLLYKVNNVVGDLIDIENIKNIPKLDKSKTYTFECSSGYKASELVKKYRQEGYNVYFKSK